MALLVWFMMGIALWHFTVFLPDHFWQGIVGAFVGAVIGSVLFGLIVWTIEGRDLADTDLATALLAIPGTAIGLAVVWAIGRRSERRAGLELPAGSRSRSRPLFRQHFPGLSGGITAGSVPSLVGCRNP